MCAAESKAWLLLPMLLLLLLLLPQLSPALLRWVRPQGRCSGMAARVRGRGRAGGAADRTACGSSSQ